MKKKLYFFYVIFVLLAVSCSRSQETLISKGTAVVAGHIRSSGKPESMVTLVSVNAMYSNRYSLIPDEQGDFLFRIEMLHPHDINLHYQEGYVGLYLHPGDSLFIEMEEDDFLNEEYPLCEISGSDPATATDVMRYVRFRGTGDFHPSFAGNPSVPDYLQQIERHIRSEDSLAGEFIRQFHPSREFRKWVKKDIIYRNANYLIDYKYHCYVNKIKYEGNLFDKTFFPVDDDGAIVTSLYGYHLWHYSTDRYIQHDSVVSKLLEDDKKAEAYHLCLDHIVENEKPGQSRDIMCFRILNALFQESFEDFTTVWKVAGHYMNNETLISLLKEKKEQHMQAGRYSVTMLDPVSDREKEIAGDFWSELLKRHKGKVIYVDIWATWCGPCLEEMPKAIELHKYFHDKPVVFVNVCLSSEKTEWKKRIEEMHIEGENYFFDKRQTKLFLGKLKDFQGYPTYLIIDKEGNIVDFHAPYPSSGEEIRKKLERLIR